MSDSPSKETCSSPDELANTVPRVRTISKTYYCGSGSYQQEVRAFVGDDMDRYLGEKGFVKRVVPKDSNSLYRCLSEQLCLNQGNFLAIKNMIEDHVQLNYKLQQLENAESIVDRTLDRLKAASFLYRIKIVIYRGRAEPQVIGEQYSRELTLCEISPNCYERVYRKNLQMPLAISQTFLYQCLYEKVINVPNEIIQEAIIQVRHDIDASGKDPTTVSTPLPHKGSAFTFCNCNRVQHVVGYRPPIPYSAVKSLDPAIYRNIAFDLYAKDRRRAVLDEKKESDRKSDDRFPVGSLCMARDGKDILRAKVISVLPDNHRYIRFDNGTERNVVVSDLRSVISQVITSTTVSSSTTSTDPSNSPTKRKNMIEYTHPVLTPSSVSSSGPSVQQVSPQFYMSSGRPSYASQGKSNGNVPVSTSKSSKEEMDRSDNFLIGSTCLVRDGKDMLKGKIVTAFPDNFKTIRFENGNERKVHFTELAPLINVPSSVLPEKMPEQGVPINSIPGGMMQPLPPYQLPQNPPFQQAFHLPPLNIPPPSIMKPMPPRRLMSSPKQSSPYYLSPVDANGEKTTWWQPPTNMPCNTRMNVAQRPMYPNTIQTTPVVVRKMATCSMPVTPIYPTPPPTSDRDLSSVFASPVRSYGCSKRTVPYIDNDRASKVNHKVEFSKKDDGSDLPEDTLTLRFYYNMGVMAYRNGYEVMNSSVDRDSMSSVISSVSVPPPSTIPLPVFPEHAPPQVETTIQNLIPFDCSVPPPFPVPPSVGSLPLPPAQMSNSYPQYVPMNGHMPVCVNGTFYFSPPVVNS